MKAEAEGAAMKGTRTGPARRTAKGDPRREARRQRAAERLAAHVCDGTCKRFRLGKP